MTSCEHSRFTATYYYLLWNFTSMHVYFCNLGNEGRLSQAMMLFGLFTASVEMGMFVWWAGNPLGLSKFLSTAQGEDN